MPIIPTYKEQEKFKNVTARNSNRFNVPPALSDFASTKMIVDDGKAEQNTLDSLSDLGKTLQGLSDSIPKLEKQSQMTSATDKFTDLKQDPEFQDKMYGENGLFSQKGEASFNLPEQFKKLAQEYGRKYGEKVRGDLGTSYFNEQLENYINTYGEKAAAHASKEHANWQLQTHFKASSLALEEAINNFDDPKLFKDATAQAMFNTRIAGQISGLSEESININVQDVASKSYMGFANKMLESGNIVEVSKILGSGMLNEADNSILSNVLSQQQKKVLSEGRKSEHIARTTNTVKLKTLAENLDTNLNHASLSGDTSNIIELSRQYKDLGDENTFKKIQKQAKIIDDNSDFIMAINEQKMPERVNTLKALDMELNNSKVKKNSRAYTSILQKKELAELNIKEYNRLLKNDPAKATKVDIQGTLAETARQRVDEQVDNGLSMSETRVLTRDEASHMANLWEDAAIDERFEIMENLKDYGLYAPKVTAELGLDFAEQLGMRHLGENNNYLPSLKRIISANSINKEQLPKVEKIEALSAEVSTNSKVFQTYINMASQNPENTILSQNISQLQKTANNLLQQNGGNVSRAVNIIDGELDSINNSKMNILFYPAKIDKDIIEYGLNNYLGEDLEQFLAASPLNNQMNSDEYLQHLRETGIWQNDFDTSEYVLLDSITKEPIKNAKGQSFRKSNRDLLTLSL